MDLYSSQAKEARMDISIFNSPDREGPDTYDSSAFMIPTTFSGRIRSLEARLFIPRDSSTKGTDAESLLAECLLATGKTLQRFELSVAFEPPEPVSSDDAGDADDGRDDREDPDRHILKKVLPDDLGDGLLSITNLWLKGSYFNWKSRAYHGLVSLRLDPSTDSPPISELEFINILEASPRLRFIDIDMLISRKVDAPYLLPVHLPDLELLVGDASLLRLIRPGSNELTVTITNCHSKVIYEALVKGFFSCANLVNFYSMNFLERVSEVCYLLSMAPRLRGLALTDIKFEGVLPDLTPHTLDTLYLLDGCTLERYSLEDMIETWALRRVVFPRASYYVRGEDPAPTCLIENHFSDLSARGILLETIPGGGNWGPHMELFLGPFH
ncbi:hypothetical protein FRC11_007135 [Ceratobasidium sp. 423]|nr:hypothetical protein FRC11_007135 [Ceratobasidium sp. 423]